jgi:hypothetical protein
MDDATKIRRPANSSTYYIWRIFVDPNVRVNECLGWWMFGSVNVWVDECSGRWMFRSMNVLSQWMFGSMNVWVKECSGLRIFALCSRSMNFCRRIYGSTNFQVDKFTGRRIFVVPHGRKEIKRRICCNKKAWVKLGSPLGLFCLQHFSHFISATYQQWRLDCKVPRRICPNYLYLYLFM